MTIYGVSAAFWRARKQKAAYDAIRTRNDSLSDSTYAEARAGRLSEDVEAPNSLHNQIVSNQAEIADLLKDLGVSDPPPTYNDMLLPVEYWSRRAALADTLVVFKKDGLVALGGVVVSTVASVTSLYV